MKERTDIESSGDFSEEEEESAESIEIRNIHNEIQTRLEEMNVNGTNIEDPTNNFNSFTFNNNDLEEQSEENDEFYASMHD